MACDRKIGPYDCCSVVQGDCLELMKALPSEISRCECGEDVSGEGGVFHIAAGHKLTSEFAADLLFADPPYGIDKAAWDKEYPAGIERYFLKLAKTVAITPGQWALNHCIREMNGDFVGIIAARNLNGMTFSPLGFGNWIPVVIAGMPAKGQDAFEFSVSGDKPPHPSPKPIEFMLKIIQRLADEGQTVIDPYFGSGTTGEACIRLGRHFLGFEISEEYCKIARDRIARVEAQPTLFEPKLEQMNFLDMAKDLK